MPRARTSAVRQRNLERRESKGAVFGHIYGVPVGRRWENRKEMSYSGVHPPIIAGIYGRQATGAYSVVLNGEFEDEDHGDHFVYIGSGGREPGVRFGPQVCDQSFDNSRNEALRMSARRKTPVRVIRGSKLNSEHAPTAGYRYDGLYLVSNPRMEPAKSGLKVCKFDFTRCSDQLPLPMGDGDPEDYRSDIAIRRKLWIASRQSMHDEKSTSVPESPTSRSTPSLIGGNSHTSLSVDDDGSSMEEEEPEDDIFGDAEDVEKEMEPVEDHLDWLKRSTAEEQGRRRYIVRLIGQHVNKVLAAKRREGVDAGGRNVQWWYNSLWLYAACAMPTPDPFQPEKMEEMYNKYEAKAKQKLAGGK